MLCARRRSFVPVTLSLAIGFTGALGLVSQAHAQTGATQPSSDTYIGVITSDDVYVRSGAAESYYPFGRVHEGDLVQVTLEKYEWVRVNTAGPAFRSIFGYVKYPKSETGRVRLSADGRTATTLGRTDVLAPNLDARNKPGDSWKPIIRLDADQTLQVIETFQTERETIHKVALPPNATGWVSKKFVRKAGPAEIARWEDELKNPAPPTIEAIDPPSADEEPPPPPVEPPVKTVPPVPQVNPVTDDDDADSSEPMPEFSETTEDTSTPTTDDAVTAPSAGAATVESSRKMAEQVKQVTMETLEAHLAALRKEPVETAEVGPLRQLYLDFASRNADKPSVVRFAEGRAEQLQIWADAQKLRAELAEARARVDMNSQEALAARKALNSGAEYAAVGRLAASTIYDGKRLPKLLRIQDAGSGRTIAYLKVDKDDHDLVSMINQLLGIVGEKTYDEALRLNIITPRRIDVLAKQE